MIINEIKKSIRSLKGIGPELSKKLGKLEIFTIGDLLTHYPRNYEDRINETSISKSLKENINANTIIEIIGHDYIGFGRKSTLKVFIQDSEKTQGTLICFGRSFLKDKLIIGKKFFISAHFIYKFNEIQSTSFDFEKYSEKPVLFNKILPIYPLTEGISQGLFRKVMNTCIKEFHAGLDNELPEYILKKYSFPNKLECIKNIHFPESFEKLKEASQALKYEELFYLQIPALRRSLEKRIQKSGKLIIDKKIQDSYIEKLPFELTIDQKNVLTEITEDLINPYPMARLLQGDVGCGKTLVALLSAILTVSAGYQVAFLVPTSILASQHYDNAMNLFKDSDINIFQITGKTEKENKAELYKNMTNGSPGIYIGTHALFSQNVTFKNLRFVIIDEQHKFGVLQRISMKEKGNNPDILLMTATPIPRTLCLTAFGDMNISVIKSKPANRKDIITHLSKDDNSFKVYSRVYDEIKKGRQAYFIYPLIEESEKLSLKDAENMFQELNNKIFPNHKIELIHSKIPDHDKFEIMNRFKNHEIDILVATSVLEVGIDVSNSTVIVIEHAERFGLSSLHQLRGRVGRGDLQSYAFLIYSNNLTEEGKQRLLAMKETSDGFKIAEEDLLIRGPGDIKGTRQSGFLYLKIADIINDLDIIKTAKKDIEEIIQRDPGLINPENSIILKIITIQ